MEFCTCSTATCVAATLLLSLQPVGLVAAAVRTISKPSRVESLKATTLFESDQSLIERNPQIKTIKQTFAGLAAILSLVASILTLSSPETGSIAAAIALFFQFCVNFSLIFLHKREHVHQGESGFAVQLLQSFSAASTIGITIILGFFDNANGSLQALAILANISQWISVVFISYKASEFTSYAKNLQNQLAHDHSLSVAPLLAGSEHQVNVVIVGAEEEEDPDMFVKRPREQPSQSDENSEDDETNGSTSSACSSRRHSQVTQLTRSSDEEYQSYANCFDDEIILTEELKTRARRESMRNRADTNETLNRLMEQPNGKKPCIDAKVIGHKIRDQKMIFIVSHIPTAATPTPTTTTANGKNNSNNHVLVERTHKQFKELSKSLSEQLKHSDKSLPLLPKAIKKDAPMDSAVITEKIVKFNRFLFYIEYNQINSEELQKFLNNSSE